ncbi:MAG: thiamine diphosphokinase [Rickettsiales bacterium]|jgi:thiamine pyrophosphokinase|nr:thiamine diphosphokinase [Rickettsiales bacterium]
MKLLFIANGDTGTDLEEGFFRKFDACVCVDGGLNWLHDHYEHIRPEFIIGDLDSARRDVLEKYRTTSKIIKKDNQDESDLMFALRYILEKSNIPVDEITIVGATGHRIDHTLCNIITLRQIPMEIPAKILTTLGEEVFLARKNLVLERIRGKTLSLIPITDISGLSCSGTKWPLTNVDLPFGFVNGISNLAEEETVNISLSAGELLVILNKTV